MAKTIVAYKTADERAAALSKYSNLHLVEEQNIADGNYLIFTDDLSSMELEERLELLESAFNEFTLGGM